MNKLNDHKTKFTYMVIYQNKPPYYKLQHAQLHIKCHTKNTSCSNID